jgi:hypothetical protein
MRSLLAFAAVLLCLLASPPMDSQAQIPPKKGVSKAEKPPAPTQVEAEAPPRPDMQGAAIPPDSCSDQLSSLMAATHNILQKQIGPDALADYINDEDQAMGAGNSWKKVRSRLKDILANEGNPGAATQ